jgi:hypothetical protein
MPIDPSIPLGIRTPQIQLQNPVAQYAQAQELNLNALKMQEAQQSMETRNMLRTADPSSPDYIDRVFRADPKLGLELLKNRATIKKEEGITAKNAAELEGQYVKNSRNTLVGVNDQAAYDSWRTDTISKMPGLAEIIPTKFSPNVKTALLSDAETYLKQNTISKTDQAKINAQTRGQDLQRIPVGFRMTKENTLEAIPGGPTTTNLSPKEMQTREAKFPQATQAVNTFEAKTTELEKDLIALRDHKGLASITGILAGRAPGLTAEGRAAEALYDKITARGGFKELQDMRAASPTGGALGNVSNQEGAQLRAAFAAIDRKQDAADVKKAIDTAIADLQGSKSRVREAYDMTYDYKGGGATKSNTPLTLDQLLEKYK